jgi:hypothetical protein
VNGDLARGERRRESDGERLERKGVDTPITRRSFGSRSTETQGGVRTPFTGRNFARKVEMRSRDRGSRPKAALATGSYEGSLTMEGIPGSHEPSFFTVRWSRRPWRLPHRPVHAQSASRLRARGRPREREHARRCVSTGGKRKRRQGCQRLGPADTVGRQRPRSRPPPATEEREARVSEPGPPKRRERRETLSSPDKPRGSQNPRGAHAAKAAERSGNARGAGARSSRTGGRSRSDAFRVLPAARVARLGGGNSRALSQKEARSTV